MFDMEGMGLKRNNMGEYWDWGPEKDGSWVNQAMFRDHDYVLLDHHLCMLTIVF